MLRLDNDELEDLATFHTLKLKQRIPTRLGALISKLHSQEKDKGLNLGESNCWESFLVTTMSGIEIS